MRGIAETGIYRGFEAQVLYRENRRLSGLPDQGEAASPGAGWQDGNSSLIGIQVEGTFQQIYQPVPVRVGVIGGIASVGGGSKKLVAPRIGIRSAVIDRLVDEARTAVVVSPRGSSPGAYLAARGEVESDQPPAAQDPGGIAEREPGSATPALKRDLADFRCGATPCPVDLANSGDSKRGSGCRIIVQPGDVIAWLPADGVEIGVETSAGEDLPVRLHHESIDMRL